MFIPGKIRDLTVNGTLKFDQMMIRNRSYECNSQYATYRQLVSVSLAAQIDQISHRNHKSETNPKHNLDTPITLAVGKQRPLVCSNLKIFLVLLCSKYFQFESEFKENDLALTSLCCIPLLICLWVITKKWLISSFAYCFKIN